MWGNSIKIPREKEGEERGEEKEREGMGRRQGETKEEEQKAKDNCLSPGSPVKVLSYMDRTEDCHIK